MSKVRKRHQSVLDDTIKMRPFDTVWMYRQIVSNSLMHHWHCHVCQGGENCLGRAELENDERITRYVLQQRLTGVVATMEGAKRMLITEKEGIVNTNMPRGFHQQLNLDLEKKSKIIGSGDQDEVWDWWIGS